MFNLYFFNLNVYMNIAQSAGGGAPRIGVVTIMNPTAQIKHGAGEYIYEDGTVTKPCILLHENDEFTYLADLHDSQMSDPELSHCIRIPKASIAHFAQLSCAFWRRNGFVYDFVEWLDGDPVYNLSAEFILKAKASEAEPLFLLETNEVDCVPGITIVSENMKSNIGSTNMVCVQSMGMGRDLSNAVVMIRFPHMSCSWGRNVVDLSASLNMKGYVDVCGLPRLNPAHEWSLDEFSITANFIRKIVSCSLSKNEIAKQSLLREGCVSFLLGLATQCRTDEDVVR